MVLLRTVLNFSVLCIFLVFRIAGFSSRTCRASALLSEFLQYDAILCVLVLCGCIQINQTMWQFILVVSAWQWRAMKRSVITMAYVVCSGFSHLSLFRSRFLFPPPLPFWRSEDVRTYGLSGMHCGSVICSPLRDSRSDGVAQNGFEFFGVGYFPCFRIVGSSFRTCRASAFLPELFE